MDRIDPKTTAFVFPGQGSQELGMGSDLYNDNGPGRLVFDRVSEAIGYSIADIIFGSDEDALRDTKNAQIAIMTVSMAALMVFMSRAGQDISGLCQAVAGHSVGEYSALCAAGVLSLEDTAKLLLARGNAMKVAAKASDGSMLALIGGDDVIAQDLVNSVKDGQVLVIANYNSREQRVLSGDSAAIDRALSAAPDFGFKRAIKLNVAGAFHSPLMKGVGDLIATAADGVVFNHPKTPIVENTTAVFESDPSRIKDLLSKQAEGSVKWLQSVDFLFQGGIRTIVEFGRGRTLSGLVKKIAPEIKVANVAGLEDVEQVLQMFPGA